MKVLAVTGYKPMEMGIFKIDDSKIEYVKETIKRRLIPLIEEGLEWILLSGQMGVEIWTGEVILELKEEYDIKVGIFPPFLNQEQRWPEAQQEQYHLLLDSVDFTQPLYQKEYEGAYQFKAKDQWLLDKSDACLILYDEETGGSPGYFLDKAKAYQEKHEYEIYMITPFDIDETVQEMMMEDPAYWLN
ncbi:hypothetical protein N782_02905 [Pontibacillus yanchengensis Y32]|uniref:UPF0398 protein N782_02905 n=2 Tax=Pontibacillus yanchengensis TaxID=462910 RepID=A0A0A2T5W0_9BACI|nr:DUF1273 domain-containing protein [Pontibacillus yanchengensis]KGP70834.1 hypothetical protein N782_02905 [Pontibacillus yanchengensis Y32]